MSITHNTRDLASSLKNAGIEYKKVADGYIVFRGQVFGCDIPLMIGIHYNPLKVEFIEIFRPDEYYQSGNYDIHVSYEELSSVMKERYGTPLITSSASIGGYPCERWIIPNFIVDHYIMERFGLEEHLHINFHSPIYIAATIHYAVQSAVKPRMEERR